MPAWNELVIYEMHIGTYEPFSATRSRLASMTASTIWTIWWNSESTASN